MKLWKQIILPVVFICMAWYIIVIRQIKWDRWDNFIRGETGLFMNNPVEISKFWIHNGKTYFLKGVSECLNLTKS